MTEEIKAKKIKFKPGRHGVSIQKSSLTRNYLVMYKDQCFDSASKYEDAVEVARWVQRQIKVGNPPPANLSDHEAMIIWISKADIPCPEVNADMFTLENGHLSSTNYNDVIKKHIESGNTAPNMIPLI